MDIKGFIKTELGKRFSKEYESRLLEKSMDYSEWIEAKESGYEKLDMSVGTDRVVDYSALSFATHCNGMTVRVVPYEKMQEINIKNYLEDILIFVRGELSDIAIGLIVKEFKRKKNVNIVYGDEDIADFSSRAGRAYGEYIEGSRRNPLFKPDWSPHVFLDRFYFGNIVAIRRFAFRDVEFTEGKSPVENLYHTLLRYLFTNEENLRCVSHISEILLHARDYDTIGIKDTSASRLAERFIIKPIKEGKGSDKDHKIKISAVIPSKDHSQMLEKCMEAIRDACPGSIDLEIIVMDNGSSVTERAIIESIRSVYKFRYEYNPMAFNFASMCNAGAKLATGEFILFLNDDVIFAEPYTLEQMLEAAKYSFTGAVGAKLLYPQTTIIQHAGVMSNRIGPVHKLQFKDDSESHYFGYNKKIQNVSAVTGACLLIRKDVFEEVGRMNEELKVAFNDVDLCFKLVEAGYFNACLNNIYLYHCESLSRGKDTDKESLVRLQQEKEKLYELHPAFKANDPYFNKHFLIDCLDSRIVPGNEYDYTYQIEEANGPKKVDLSKAREDNCVKLNVEYAGAFEDFSYVSDGKQCIYLQGFLYISGSDNAFYKRGILLMNKNTCYLVPFVGATRFDVQKSCEDEINVKLAGYSIKLDSQLLPPGTYRVGGYAAHEFAREKLYVFSNRELVIK